MGRGAQKARRKVVFTIYALTDPRDNTIRYIGRSCAGDARIRSHWAPHPRKPWLMKNKKLAWIEELRASGAGRYGSLVLEEVVGYATSARAEVRWIAHGFREGWPLTNGNRGGKGGATKRLREARSRAYWRRQEQREGEQEIRLRVPFGMKTLALRAVREAIRAAKGVAKRERAARR